MRTTLRHAGLGAALLLGAALAGCGDDTDAVETDLSTTTGDATGTSVRPGGGASTTAGAGGAESKDSTTTTGPAGGGPVSTAGSPGGTATTAGGGAVSTTSTR